jgi:hypothetical protein
MRVISSFLTLSFSSAARNYECKNSILDYWSLLLFSSSLSIRSFSSRFYRYVLYNSSFCILVISVSIGFLYESIDSGWGWHTWWLTAWQKGCGTCCVTCCCYIHPCLGRLWFLLPEHCCSYLMTWFNFTELLIGFRYVKVIVGITVLTLSVSMRWIFWSDYGCMSWSTKLPLDFSLWLRLSFLCLFDSRLNPRFFGLFTTSAIGCRYELILKFVLVEIINR